MLAPNSVSLMGLSAWLDKQPKDEIYPFYRAMDCAVAQYRTSLSAIHHNTALRDFSPGYIHGVTVHHFIANGELHFGFLGLRCGNTFGAAAERARYVLDNPDLIFDERRPMTLQG